MIKSLKYIIFEIGISNFLTILTSLIAVLVSYYLYYRAFFRLAYSTNRICKTCNNSLDWKSEETEFETRILFYNNGRKTIYRSEIQKLEVISSNKINSFRVIKGDITLNHNQLLNSLNIDFEYLDSANFFILELNHNGQLEVMGRISETGKVLHTEPKYWTLINIIFLVFFFVIIFYNIIVLSNNQEASTFNAIYSLILLLGISGVIRYIHSLLFIPDSVTSYIDIKDKFAKEFKIKYS